jgi:predicted AlkP superfamily pyrophosphatase or phosphodiesterase
MREWNRGIRPRRLAVTLLGVAACGPGGRPAPASAPARAPAAVVLVSIDGFRYDYLDRITAPNLHRMVDEGIRAPLVPVFPSKTFPNHYSIVTGLYPAHHGIVDNTFYDPAFDAVFRISDSVAVADARWWGGEPVWVTAERQGLVAASFFWPGSEAPIDGDRPRYWEHYDGRVPDSTRVRQVLEWLVLPLARRPRFVTLYFSDVDAAGHRFGPASPEVAAAILHVDSAMGMLLDGLRERHLDDHVNVIVVSDHGMAATSPDSVVALDDYVEFDLLANVVSGNPLCGLWPRPGMEDSVYRELHGRNPHLMVWRRDEIPERFHYRGSRRIPPVLAVARVGWTVALHRADLVAHPERFRGGAHGYDDTLPQMRAVFLAAGPAFRKGVVASAFRNIHIYDLIAAILGLTPAPNDGSVDSTAGLLRR